MVRVPLKIRNIKTTGLYNISRIFFVFRMNLQGNSLVSVQTLGYNNIPIINPNYYSVVNNGENVIFNVERINENISDFPNFQGKIIIDSNIQWFLIYANVNPVSGTIITQSFYQLKNIIDILIDFDSYNNYNGIRIEKCRYYLIPSLYPVCNYIEYGLLNNLIWEP